MKILPIGLLFAIAATVVSRCTKSTTLDCSSHGYKYSRCQVAGAKRVQSVNVTTKYSRSDCNYGSGFGAIGANIWVHNGCRAKFNVCYKPGKGDSCKYIDCSSHNNKYARCSVSGATRMTGVALKDQYSTSDCSLGHSFGIKGTNVFVKLGCQGKFDACYR